MNWKHLFEDPTKNDPAYLNIKYSTFIFFVSSAGLTAESMTRRLLNLPKVTEAEAPV